jgi:hypothetical protein
MCGSTGIGRGGGWGRGRGWGVYWDDTMKSELDRYNGGPGLGCYSGAQGWAGTVGHKTGLLSDDLCRGGMVQRNPLNRFIEDIERWGWE